MRYLFLLALSVTVAVAANPEQTRQLIAVLNSNAALHEKARACQQLAAVGTEEAVPALAALLAEERLGTYAREALEGINHPSARAALRAELGRLRGPLLAGVVTSLGTLRDAEAAPQLIRIAQDVSSGAAPQALLALGQMATADIARFLEKTLARSPVDLRPAAAEACLLAAEQRFEQGFPAEALPLYEAVRNATAPIALRAAATRGVILAGNDAGRNLLVQQLTSDESAMRDMALHTIRDLRDPAVTTELVSGLETWIPDVQARVIEALAERGGDIALQAVESRMNHAASSVRIAASRALGRFGRDSSLPLLLRAATSGRSAEESAAALRSLARTSAPGADAFLIDALANADPPIQVKLIDLLGSRGAVAATKPILQLAKSSHSEVAAVSFRALGLVAQPADLPELIRLATQCDSDELKTLADRAIVTTTFKVPEVTRRADAVLAAFRATADERERVALLRPLGAIVRAMKGSYDAFVAVRSVLNDPSEAVRDTAVRTLADWPDATPATTLLALARREASPARREIALRGALRLAGNVAAGRDRSPLDAGAFLQAANGAIHTDAEKLMIVSALGGLGGIEAFNLLRPYLDDPSVHTEAALAVVQIAPALMSSPHASEVKAVLQRIANDEKDEDIRRMAAQAAQRRADESAKREAPALPAGPPRSPTSLFNGLDLTGWEGDPAVWRVQDGVIVGGSLDGNPRNEFLATRASFRNFILRLEYRLVGTEGFVNGGVQLRSRRIAQPPNEMSGYQADIGAGLSGALYDESRRRKVLAAPDKVLIVSVEKPGDWNLYEIHCEGSRIRLVLNGTTTVDYQEQETGIEDRGVFALQIHGKCKAEISFRNLVIEALPD